NYPPMPKRINYLSEALQIILKMWTDDQANFEGKYCSIRGAINQPKGIQKPHIPLLIGGKGEQSILRLVAQYGDACNISYSSVPVVAHKFAILKQHCEGAMRDYNSIRRTILIDCLIAETESEALAKVPPVELDELGNLKESTL